MGRKTNRLEASTSGEGQAVPGEDRLRIFSGRANEPLAGQIAASLSQELGDVTIEDFPDGEIFVRYNENIRGMDVFIIQPTCPPASNIMELLIMIDAAARASANRVTAVVPYFGYARQDRKDQPRVSIAAKLMANLFSVAGADRLLTMDLHAGQIQGFFDIPLDHLYARPVLAQYFRQKNLENVIVLPPDLGGTRPARAFAGRLNAGLAIVEKRRHGPTDTEISYIIGEVKDKNCIIVDDVVSTAGTLARVVEALAENGARKIYAAITHGLLCDMAVSRLKNSPLEELVVTNSIPWVTDARVASGLGEKLTVLSVAALLGEAIRRIHLGESVSCLFEDIPAACAEVRTVPVGG